MFYILNILVNLDHNIKHDDRVSPTLATKIIRQVKENVSNWQAVAKKIGISSQEINLMNPAFLKNLD